MSFKVIVSLISFFINAVYCADEVPVVLWGTGMKSINNHVSALKKLSAPEFENFVKKLSSNEPPVIAAFIEPSLSMEDFQLQDGNEISAFPLMQQRFEVDDLVTFLPYVKDPIKALDLLKEKGYVSTSDLRNLPGNPKNLMVVKLDDAKDDETRVEMLRRHDKIIHETCSAVEEKYGNGNAVCVLTASRKSWIESEMAPPIRHLLDVPSAVTNESIVFYENHVGLIYTKNLTISLNNIVCSLSAPTVPPTNDKSSMEVYVPMTCPGDSKADRVRLEFKFTSDNRTWTLSSISVLKDKKFNFANSSILISASIGNSYHTPAVVVFQDADNNTLNFTSIQAEFFSKPSTTAAFGPADDSVTFFTIPIISGLFVTSLIVTIVLLGLSMIFDIKTMDQFDDPKGKTVTINASE
jgi:V-type H+-transporting ATPase S1 subunit